LAAGALGAAWLFCQEARGEELAPPETRRPLLDAAVGLGAMSRSLDYRDDYYNVLSSYGVPATLSVQGTAQVYPFTRTKVAVLEDVGLLASAQAEPHLMSSNGVKTFPTLSDRWQAGVVYRVVLGPLELSPSASYGRQEFAVETPTPGPIPSVDYSLFAFGLGVRLALLKAGALLLGADYLDVTSTGEIGSPARFPRLTVGGVEGTVGFALTLKGPWEARFLLDYRRYFYSFNPQPGDPYVAGGALDDYFTANLGLAARWP
jgi:hypothetical protein